MTVKTPAIENPVDALLPAILEAVSEWKAKNSPSTIKSRVTKQLDENTKEIVFKLLGFNNNWGNWELDHCNGRDGNSAAGDYLRQVQSEAIREWLETVEIPPLSTALKKKFRNEFNDFYYTRVKNRLQSAALEQADKDVAELLKECTESNQLSNYLKTLKLLNPSIT